MTDSPRRWKLSYPRGNSCEPTEQVILRVGRHEDDTLDLVFEGLQRCDLHLLFHSMFSDAIDLALREDDFSTDD